MDVKKIGRIPDGGGWRVHGRDRREATRDRAATPGYDYVHSLVDDHTRLAYCEVLPDEKGPTCAAFLQRATGYFAAHGNTRIHRVMTDNAWAYRWSLRGVCAQLGIRQKFIKPHCPWQNGKVERLNRTLAAEWAYRQAYLSNNDRTAALAPGSTTTTIAVATARSAANPRSAGCNQRHDRVHLGRLQSSKGVSRRSSSGTGVSTVDDQTARAHRRRMGVAGAVFTTASFRLTTDHGYARVPTYPPVWRRLIVNTRSLTRLILLLRPRAQRFAGHRQDP
jgi:transposase InsO family protein